MLAVALCTLTSTDSAAVAHACIWWIGFVLLWQTGTWKIQWAPFQHCQYKHSIQWTFCIKTSPVLKRWKELKTCMLFVWEAHSCVESLRCCAKNCDYRRRPSTCVVNVCSGNSDQSPFWNQDNLLWQLLKFWGVSFFWAAASLLNWSHFSHVYLVSYFPSSIVVIVLKRQRSTW